MSAAVAKYRSMHIFRIASLFLIVGSLYGADNPDLQKYIAQGLRNNSLLQQARLRISEMQSGKYADIARLIPTINVNGQLEGQQGIFGTTQYPYTNYSTELAMSLPIFDYINNFNRISLSASQERLSKEQYYALVSDVIFQIKRAYREIQFNQRQLSILSNIVARKEENVRIQSMERQFDVESAAAINVIKNNIERTRHSMLIRSVNLENSKRTLAILTGEQENENIIAEEQESDFPNYTVSNVVACALQNTVKIKEIDIETEMDKSRLSSVEMEYWPVCRLYGIYQYYGNTIRSYQEIRFGGTVTYPLFGWVETIHQASAIKNRIQGRTIVRNYQRESVVRTTIDLLERYNLLKKERVLIQTERDAALQYYQILKQYFRQGKISYAVLEPQEDKLFGIELGSAENIFNLYTAKATIEALTENVSRNDY